MTISITQDCTIYMHEPGPPLLKTTRPVDHVCADPLRDHAHIDFAPFPLALFMYTQLLAAPIEPPLRIILSADAAQPQNRRS
jgi:hypothetical protein